MMSSPRTLIDRLPEVSLLFTRVPAEIGGIALNLAAFALWFSALSELHPSLQEMCNTSAWPVAFTAKGLKATAGIESARLQNFDISRGI